MEKSAGRNRLQQLEEVIVAFQDRLFRFAFFRTGSFADSQDIVQDVFIKLYSSSQKLEGVGNMSGYLYRSIANACTDYLRKHKRRQFETIDDAVLPVGLLENEASHHLQLMEEYCRIDKLLDGIPPEQAEIIQLRVFDELSFVEIAELTQTAVTTVKSRFAYGIEKLRTKIGRKEDVYGL